MRHTITSANLAAALPERRLAPSSTASGRPRSGNLSRILAGKPGRPSQCVGREEGAGRGLTGIASETKAAQRADKTHTLSVGRHSRRLPASPSAVAIEHKLTYTSSLAALLCQPDEALCHLRPPRGLLIEQTGSLFVFPLELAQLAACMAPSETLGRSVTETIVAPSPSSILLANGSILHHSPLIQLATMVQAN